MSDDSNDLGSQPSCSRGRQTDDMKKKRRIVMRIEFDDSNESDADSYTSELTDDSNVGVEFDEQPSSSKQALRRSNRCVQEAKLSERKKEEPITTNRIRRNRIINMDATSSDESSNGSEIGRRQTKRRKKRVVISEDEDPKAEEMQLTNEENIEKEENGFTSDSSSNDLLEKCPICLLTFRQQEIGSPSSCQHIFCANCIEAWSKNVHTCPIDRLEFDHIIVRSSYTDRSIVREIQIDPKKANKELVLEDEDVIADDEELTYCEYCESPDREDVMLLCDVCNRGAHIYCLSPPLDEIPSGPWYCEHCFEPDSDDTDLEDLNALYDDIRDMGIPDARLRVTEVQQPRIMRTRQNERIRAAVLRRTRSNTVTERASPSERARGTSSRRTTGTERNTSRSGGRGEESRHQLESGTTTTLLTTTTTTTTTRTTRTTKKKTTRRRRRAPRRRRQRYRTYVVEYDLNDYDEKFALKTTRKVIRRRRRKRRVANRTKGETAARSASKRLAEQLGVKKDMVHGSRFNESAPSFSLFGNANDLEYFSDDDEDNVNSNIPRELQLGGGGIQTAVRLSNYGSQNLRSRLLAGKASTVRPRPIINETTAPAVDLLSNLMDMQDRWHNVTRNMERVRIKEDGTLQFEENKPRQSIPKINADTNRSPIVKQTTEKTDKSNTQPAAEISLPTESSGAIPNSNVVVTEAPMYPRGGGNPNFNNSGGGGGGYNNNRFTNSNNFHSAGSAGNRHSTGSSSTTGSSGLSAYNSNMMGSGNFNYDTPNYNTNRNQDTNTNFSPFNAPFNQRNQQRNNNDNNQRNSLPFMNCMDNNIQMQQQQQQPPQQQHLPVPMYNPQHPCMPMDSSLFGGIPPPVCPPQPCDMGLFGGLPPPVVGPTAPVLTVPPPPAPPPGVQLPWNNSLFQLNTNYSGADDEEDSNCPNFAVYSAESQEVAKSTKLLNSKQNNNASPPKDVDGNEDLVQLDDDDEEIPLPPESSQPNNAKIPDSSDLYEPENPTEENDDDEEDDDKQKEEEEKSRPEVSDRNKTHEDEDDDNDEDEEEDGEEEEDDEEKELPADEVNSDIKIETPHRKFDKSSDKEDENNDQIDAEQETNSSQIISKNNDNDTNDKLSSVTTEDEHSKATYMEDGDNEKSNESNDNEKLNKKNCENEQPQKSSSSSPATFKSKKRDDNDGNRKGVLELYDEEDWEEVNIERPKISIILKTTKLRGTETLSKADKEEREARKEKTPEKVTEQIGEKSPEKLNEEPTQQDRSYTPCLDEKNDPEEGEAVSSPEQERERDSDCDKNHHSDSEGELVKTTPLATDNSPKSHEGSTDSRVEAEKELDIPNTEMISEDDDSSRERGKRRSRKRSKRDRENGETFKKVSSKQRERNYRSEKQLRVKNRRRSGSRRRADSARSRSRSRSHSRPRSRSQSRPVRSRSHSPRRRVRGIRRSFSRSRSRSINNKENMGWRQGFNRMNGRRPLFRPNFQNRFKRREMPRYDVRHVVGNMRHINKDRYGRDTTRGMRFSRSPSRGRAWPRSFSRSRSRSRSISPNRRNRRVSFSMSPTPPHLKNNRRSVSSPRRRLKSPPKRRRSTSSFRRLSPPHNVERQRSRTPPAQTYTRSRSRSMSASPAHQMNGRRVTRHIEASPLINMRRKSASKSPSRSPHFTPRPSRSISRTPPPHEKISKKKKVRDRKKKKSKKRAVSMSLEPVRRLSRQRDPFTDNVEEQPPPKNKRRRISKATSPVAESAWSPSPSPPPPAIHSYEDRTHDINMSWTPPIVSPTQVRHQMSKDIYDHRRSRSRSSKREKRKRAKKKKRLEKRAKESRKDMRRLRRTVTPDVAPSKEVFASGNNILVSVSFNKDANSQHQQSQNTVVTVPPNREDLLNRRPSRERFIRSSSLARRRKERALKRKKLDTKPVAIIDLERSPFQVHQEPADVIVLTDSEEANGSDDNEHRRDRERDRDHHRRINESSGIEDDDDHCRINMNNSGRSVDSPNDKASPMERLDTIMEESYELLQTGPKTPPEPPGIKFTMPTKKQNKVRNPLHDEADMNSDIESQDHPDAEQYRAEIEAMHTQVNQKMGPNTPPESGPCSPDVYDPCEPTKSPSISPRSPTPRPAMDVSQTSTIGESIDNDLTVSRQKHTNEDTAPPHMSVERTSQQTASGTTQAPTLNPVELVMKLINSKSNTSQDLSNKPNEPPFPATSHVHNNSIVPGLGINMHDENMGMQRNEKSTEEHPKAITVLSNVLISAGPSQQPQHIPVISSPSPKIKTTSIMKLPMPKVTGSVGSSSSGIGLPLTNVNLRNGTGPTNLATGGGGSGNIDDSFNLDFDSPYSPGSADYEDLFDPPPDTNNAKRRSKRNTATGKGEMFDNLFGTSSPVGGYLRLPTYTPSKSKGLTADKKKGKGMYDEFPNSAVDLQSKDKFLRKLNRQERVVEEVKLILKPRFNKKQITKEDYKEIMRRAVPKICHSRSGEINPHKIKNLIDAYVKKFRAKHKKLNLINTGQVSSAVKCAAYLKKL